ncbi:MAG: acyltransferase [Deltaproteobacteria bacterium]
MSSSSAATDRIKELDVLRGIAILAVVGLHISWEFLRTAPLDQISGKALAAIHLSTGFGVPLFVMLSGVGLALRYTRPMSWSDYGSFMYRRASRLLPAYVAWSMLMALRTDPALLWPPGRLASLFLTGNAGPQFYFIPLIFQLYLLWPLLRPAAVAAQRTPLHAMVVAVVGTAFSLLWWQLSAHGVVGSGTLALPAFFLLYMAAGLALTPHLERLRSAGRTCTVAAAVLAVTTAALMLQDFLGMLSPDAGMMARMIAATIFRPLPMAYIYATIAFSVFLAFATGQRAEGRPATALAELGRHSYGIFLVHLLVLEAVVGRILEPPAPEHFTNGWWVLRALVTSVLCLGLSYGVTRILSGRRGLRILVGANA